MKALLSKSGLWLWCGGLMLAVIGMVQLSLPYVSLQKNVDFLLTKQKVYHIDYWRLSFYLHVFTGVLVLPAGFTQFYPRFFSRGRHRKLGMLYLYTVLVVGAPTGFLMGLHA